MIDSIIQLIAEVDEWSELISWLIDYQRINLLFRFLVIIYLPVKNTKDWSAGLYFILF